MSPKGKTTRKRTVKPAGVRCMFCTHWRELSNAHGQCHRFPRLEIKAYTDWCGEFKEANKSERQDWPVEFGYP